MYKYTHYLEHYAHASPLRHWNASFKAAFSIAVLFLCLWLDSIPVSLWVILSMAAIAVAGAGVKPGEYVRIMGIPLFFLVSGGIGLWFVNGEILQVLHVTLRSLSAVSAFYFLVLSTPVSGIVAILDRCHTPGMLTSLMYLLYRYIFILTETWQDMHAAARSRLGYVDYRTSIRTFGAVGGNLLVVSMQRADQCYNAMESRCFTGEIRFLEEHTKCGLGEWAFAVLYLASVAVVRGLFG